MNQLRFYWDDPLINCPMRLSSSFKTRLPLSCRRAAKSSTCTQIFQLSLARPTFLIPVLNSLNGTWTKVILHLQLLPLAFHLILRLFILPPSPAPRKGCIWFRTHALQKHKAPAATWAKAGMAPISGSKEANTNVSLGSSPTNMCLCDVDWWKLWRRFKGGQPVKSKLNMGM